MLGQGLSVGELNATAVAAFVQVRRATRSILVSEAALGPVLRYLRGIGVLPAWPAPVSTDPVEVLLAGFGAYLGVERGMGPLNRKIEP